MHSNTKTLVNQFMDKIQESLDSHLKQKSIYYNFDFENSTPTVASNNQTVDWNLSQDSCRQTSFDFLENFQFKDDQSTKNSCKNFQKGAGINTILPKFTWVPLKSSMVSPQKFDENFGNQDKTKSELSTCNSKYINFEQEKDTNIFEVDLGNLKYESSVNQTQVNRENKGKSINDLNLEFRNLLLPSQDQKSGKFSVQSSKTRTPIWNLPNQLKLNFDKYGQTLGKRKVSLGDQHDSQLDVISSNKTQKRQKICDVITLSVNNTTQKKQNKSCFQPSINQAENQDMISFSSLYLSQNSDELDQIDLISQ